MRLSDGFLAGLFCALIVVGCTESPFKDDISPPPTKITGRVDLHRIDGDNSNVYVWLDGLNVSTHTDSAGHFELQFPREVNSGNAVTGAFKLYCFVANYSIATAEIIVNDGLFQYSQGDLDRLGHVNHVMSMFKILHITTIVQPRWVASDSDDPIDVQVTLQAVTDSVTVIFPKSVGGLLGGLFFRSVETGQIFIDIPDEGADTREHVRIGQQPLSRRGVFQLNGSNFRDLTLPIGNYEIIPFFFIEHEDMPQKLFDSIGEKVDEPDPEFLKIPFKRDGGRFRVIG